MPTIPTRTARLVARLPATPSTWGGDSVGICYDSTGRLSTKGYALHPTPRRPPPIHNEASLIRPQGPFRRSFALRRATGISPLRCPLRSVGFLSSPDCQRYLWPAPVRDGRSRGYTHRTPQLYRPGSAPNVSRG